MKVSGIGVRMTSGSLERAELRNHEDVDPEQGHAEGRTHVAEGHPGDFPFAVPQQRRDLFVGRAGR
jgi:hypothetical protein